MFDRVWEDQIAINPRTDQPFVVLPPAGALPDRTSWSIDPTKLDLPLPLAHYIASDDRPIPTPEDREGYYGDRHFEYWLSGLETSWRIVEMCREHKANRGCFVELGCATGRVLRHMAVQRWFDDVWGLDINSRHISWLSAHFGQLVRAVQNTSIPSLPLEDRSVDCLAAFSVFSHVEHFETMWLAELRRVMAPDGIAILSFVTDYQLRVMTPQWPMYAPFLSHPLWGDDVLDRVARQGKEVFRWGASRSYSSNVVYSRDHLRRLVEQFFTILEYRQEFPIYQDTLVLRRR